LKNIINYIINLKKSEFIKNIFTLVSGTSIAQVISLFTAPILYRIYSKEDYGTLGLYMAIVGVISVFSTMQYLQPILLVKEDIEAKKIMWLNRIINVLVTLIVLLLVIVLKAKIGVWLNNENIVYWLYLIPISIFFSGQNEIFRVWANRKKKYKIMSFNTILIALLVPFISITFGFFNNGPLGLFLGLVSSQVVPSIVLLVYLTRDESFGLEYLDINEMKLNAKTYANYPIYNLPSEFLSRITNSLPVFMLSVYVGPAAVGVYNLCMRMLGLPSSILGGAISEVFKQKASSDYNSLGSYANVFKRTLKSLTLLTIIPLIVIVLFGPQIFTFVFGVEWIDSGLISQVLIIYFMLKFIVSPLSYTVYIKNKIHIVLIKNIFSLIIMFLVFRVGFYFEYDYKFVLGLFGVSYALLDLIYLYYLYHLSKEKIIIP
jgi:O-antigen/teichoic acid export membrane protein